MRLYWRPGKVSNPSLAVLALVALSVLLVVEHEKVIIKQEYYDEKQEAVRLQVLGMEAIKAEALRVRRRIDPSVDPLETGLIGQAMSPLTSVVGYLEAKQTSVNPNFAALIVQLMKEAGLREGDRVAIGASGSFPALNLAVLVGCKVLKLRCVMVTSVAASMYGANHPRLTWLDMERVAYRAGAIDVRSSAASIGGTDDNGGQLSEEGVELILRAIERNKVPLIREGSLQGNIEARMRLYEQAAQGEPYKAYINIGGSEASVGSHFTKVLFKPGINRSLPRKRIRDEGVMTLMMRRYKVPVIHLSKVSQLAEKYGLPLAPKKMPPLGEGPLFYNVEYNVTLTAVLFAILVAITVLVVRFDIGRLFKSFPNAFRAQGDREATP